MAALPVILDMLARRILGQSGPKLDILVVVPRVLQVGVLVCPALFHHVQAHFGGAAFLPNFIFSHFSAFCGQIQCFFFQWHFSDFVVPLKPAML